ncbi:hypothetical protein GGI18_006433, partial [Coemansia linderi]
MASGVGAQWQGDMNLVSSLLSTIRALLRLTPCRRALANLFVATGEARSTAGSDRSWLIEELWMNGVSNVVLPLGGSGVVDSQQRVNRSVRVGAVVKSLDMALALLDFLDDAALLDQWVFVEKVDASPDDMQGLLGLSSFGQTVVCDVIGTWRAAQSILREEDRAVSVVSGCLEILALVISRRQGAELAAFWLSLWRQSMPTIAGHAKEAAGALSGFVRRMSTRDMLEGDSGLVSSMANSMLLQLLQSESDDVVGALGVVAQLLAADSRELLVSDSVQARFVVVLTEQLAAAPAALSTLLDVPLCLAQSAVPVLPALARAVIPVLAKLAYAQDEPG